MQGSRPLSQFVRLHPSIPCRNRCQAPDRVADSLQASTDRVSHTPTRRAGRNRQQPCQETIMRPMQGASLRVVQPVFGAVASASPFIEPLSNLDQIRTTVSSGPGHSLPGFCQPCITVCEAFGHPSSAGLLTRPVTTPAAFTLFTLMHFSAFLPQPVRGGKV